MAQTLESLSRRTASMQGIRSVVHTMKTLSVINSAPYEHAATAIEAYHATVLEGLHAVLSQARPNERGMPDFAGLGAAGSKDATRVMAVFGSDHGLCGNYNEALAAHVAQSIDTSGAQAPILLCIGAQMADALSDQGLAVEKLFFPPASVDGIGRLANVLTRALDDIRHGNPRRDMAVSLAYFARAEGGAQAPQVAPLLPLDPALVRDLRQRPWRSRSLPYYSMPPADLFMALLRGHIFASLFRASAEALVTENAARLALMQQAEQTVDDRLDDLQSETRTLRQTEITTELMDVIIGFEALKKRKRKSTSRAEDETDPK